MLNGRRIENKYSPKPAEDFIDKYADDFNLIGVGVFLAMSEEQALREGVKQCLLPPIPQSYRIYNLMLELNESLCNDKITKHGSWERIITTTRDKIPEIFRLWYPDGIANWDYQKLLDRIDGESIHIIGFGD